MRRDSIFYKLFSRSPAALFSLISDPPANAAAYRFDSVAVKEPRFEIDGIFLPPDDTIGTVFFCEIQFQKDQTLYERILAEIALYFYRNRARFSDWKIVVIYPSRRTEQDDAHPYRWLIASDQFYRVYLDELGDIRQLDLWLAVMVLTTLSEARSPAAAKSILNRAQQEAPSETSHAIIDMVVTVISYQFKQLSFQQVKAMLDITFEETRVYREIKQEGRQEEAVRLTSRLLTKKLGDLPKSLMQSVNQLSLPLLEELSEALLDFSDVVSLQAWLQEKLDETSS